MFTHKTDFGHVMGRQSLEIHQLVSESTVDMFVQRLRDRFIRHPAVIVKRMDAGLRIPFAVQYEFSHFGIKVTAM